METKLSGSRKRVFFYMAMAEAIRVNREMIDSEDRPLVLRALYLLLLNPDGAHFRDGWGSEGLVGQATELLHRHVESWNNHQENENNPTVVLRERPGNDGWLSVVDRTIESEKSYIESNQLEQNEYMVLNALWQWAHTSVDQNLTDEQFLEQANEIIRSSVLFRSLRELEIVRTNGTTKQVWPHVEDVTGRSTSNFSLNDFEQYTSAQRKAEQRFVAITHDIANLLFADADFLQFHAHASAELLYTFFRQQGFDHTEAARIVRVVDLHHILELVRLENGMDNPNRVLTPQEVVRAFAAMENGWEIFGRLMLFCMVDVGEKELFKAEHVTAVLAMVQALVTETELAISDEVKQRNAIRAVKTATTFVDEMNRKYELKRAEAAPQAPMETQAVPTGLQAILAAIQGYMNTLRENLVAMSILPQHAPISLEESSGD